MNKRDYLIVGGGIAGISLAHELESRSKSFLLINHNQQSASLAANAIINPITGRRLVKTWLADELMRNAELFYREIENKLRTSFFKTIQIFKIIPAVKEANDWLARCDADNQAFLDSEIRFINPETYHNPHGCIHIRPAYHIQPILLLHAYHRYLQQIESYCEMEWSSESVRIGEDGLEWNGILFRKVILCRGYGDVIDPLFSELPFRANKGEALLIEKSIPLEDMISSSYVLNAYDKDRLYAGSTVDRERLNSLCTEDGLREIKKGVNKFLKAEIRVLKQLAAVRAAVVDYRPLIGTSAKSERILIFNGFGTKGFSLAPYFAKKMVDFCEELAPLPEEVNVSRFQK